MAEAIDVAVNYETIVDRLADLLLLADAAGFDMDEITNRARMHADAEIVRSDEMAVHDAAVMAHPAHEECADGCGLAVTHDGACLDKPGGNVVCNHDE